MILTKATKRNIVLFVSAFILCGVLHVALYGVDFALDISSVLSSFPVILWALAVRKRVTDKRLCTLMLCSAAMLVLHFVLQIFRYSLFADDFTAQRYLWYAMYLPMTTQPALCFYIALFIHRPEEKPLPRGYLLVGMIGAMLILSVMTNDLHFMFKSFPSGVMADDGREKSGWLFYAINFFDYGLYAVTLAVIYKKTYLYVERKYRWTAAVPLLIGVVYFTFYPLGIAKKLFGTHVWNMGEMLCFCIISTLEICIQTGMIPANRGYDELFSSIGLPAVILDNANEPVFRTENTVYPFSDREDTHIVSHPVQGGSIEYLVDVEQIRRLNRELAERVERLKVRNAYVAEETRVAQERTELQTRSRLYEKIAQTVKPQLEKIEAALNAPGDVTDPALARIAVLKAYIKRRSNMELLGTSGTLTVLELTTAISESLEYVRLCGVNAASNSAGTGIFPAGMIIAAYENFESVVEDSLTTLSALAVSVQAREGRLTVRLMLTADSFSYESRQPGQNGTDYASGVSISKEGQDMIIVFTFAEGGGKQ